MPLLLVDFDGSMREVPRPDGDVTVSTLQEVLPVAELESQSARMDSVTLWRIEGRILGRTIGL